MGIRKERGKLANLYLMLLNSPPIANGWPLIKSAGIKAD
jgi:hypothetical protein